MKKAMIPVVGVAALTLGVFLEKKFGIASKVTKLVPTFGKKKDEAEVVEEVVDDQPAAKPESEKSAETQEGTK